MATIPAMSAPEAAASLADAQHTLDVLHELSELLNTGLDRATLGTLVSLCEHGVHPEALAALVIELRREGASLQAEEEGGR